MRKKNTSEGLDKAMKAIMNKMTAEEKRVLLHKIQEKIYEENKIGAGDWSSTHPNGMSCGGDKFYANLTNDITHKLLEYKIDLQRYPAKEIVKWASTLAAYLEDFVSDTHIWDSFRNLYKAKYGKWLPFYDTGHDDYFTDDINIEDVKFLLWQCLARNGQRNEIFNSPYSPGIDTMADALFPSLIDAVEKAPRAARVVDYLRKAFEEEDLVCLRDISYWLVVRNPIFCDMYLSDQIEDEIDTGIRQYPGYEEKTVEYTVMTAYAWNDYFGPMGCKSSAYIGEIAKMFGYERMANKFSDVNCVDMNFYNVVEVTADNLIAVDVTGCEYVVSKRGFQKGVDLDKAKSFAGQLMGVSGVWMINGMSIVNFDGQYDEEFLMRHLKKNVAEKSQTVVDENRRLIEANGGCRVFSFKNLQEVKNFLGDSKLLPVDPDVGKKTNNLVLTLSETGTRNLISNGNRLIKFDGNRHYKKKECAKDGLVIPMLYTINDDVAHYFAENNLMPDMSFHTSQGGDLGHKAMQENMEFIFGFLRFRPVDPAGSYMSDDSDWEDLK